MELSSKVEQILLRAKAQYGGAAMSTKVETLPEDTMGPDLRAPGFPVRL